jgi:hypothetical protein
MSGSRRRRNPLARILARAKVPEGVRFAAATPVLARRGSGG